MTTPFVIFFLQEAIAYLPLIMLTSATVSAGISKKLVKAIGNKVTVNISLIQIQIQKSLLGSPRGSST